MTIEELRSKVAKAMGWIEDIKKTGVFLLSRYRNINTKQRAIDLPNYPEDLTACAEMFRSLDKLERAYYASELDKIVAKGNSGEESMPTCEATARQRCEAFLKMKGVI